MTKPPKKRVTKPSFEPTDDERKTVELMCAVGIAHEGIALCIRDGIDDKTLRKHFRAELDTAVIKANAKVGGAMFNKAIKGDVSAQKYWMNCRAGWKETSVQETKDIGVDTNRDQLLRALEKLLTTEKNMPETMIDITPNKED